MAVFTHSEPRAVFENNPLLDSMARALTSFWTAMSEARMRQAEKEVNAYLMSLDDATLAKYGADRLMSRSARSRPQAH